jgi:hypothetical protein
VHTGQLAPVGHLAYTHTGESELPEMTARSSVGGVPIAQSYRTGIARLASQFGLGVRARGTEGAHPEAGHAGVRARRAA